jgi:hypothetical protein
MRKICSWTLIALLSMARGGSAQSPERALPPSPTVSVEDRAPMPDMEEPATPRASHENRTATSVPYIEPTPAIPSQSNDASVLPQTHLVSLKDTSPSPSNGATVPSNAPPAPLPSNVSKLVQSTPAPSDSCGQPCFYPSCGCPWACGAPRLWADLEALDWWRKSEHVSQPLLTTGSGLHAGEIGDPNTTVLMGDEKLAFDSALGGRLTLGAWLDDCRCTGVEWRAFVLEKVSSGRTVLSDGADPNSPILYTPVTVIGQGNAAYPLPSTAANLMTSANLTATSRLWGTEVNMVENFSQCPSGNVDFIVGFRYAELEESLSYGTRAFRTDIADTWVDSSDQWQTRNEFYGVQLGGKVERTWGRLFFDGIGKVALGVTHEVGTVDGVVMSNAGVTQHSGLFTDSSNIGQQTRDRFTVLPELELRCGLNLNQHVRTFVGYDLMIWNNVVRPGTLVDTRTDTNVPPRAPTNDMPVTSFWAQGINFGLEWQY